MGPITPSSYGLMEDPIDRARRRNVMSENSSGAWIEEVQAYRLRDRLWFDGKARVSSSCSVAFIEQSPLAIWPPQFCLLQHQDAAPGNRCAAIMEVRKIGPRPGEHSAPTLFHYPKDEPKVVLRDATGSHELVIKDVRIPPQVLAFDGGGGDLPSPFGNKLSAEMKTKFDLVEATGYSSAYSVGEAIRDAMAHLPASGSPSYPDELAYFAVVSIGAEVGGFAGFDRMRVVIQTLVDKAQTQARPAK